MSIVHMKARKLFCTTFVVEKNYTLLINLIQNNFK